MFVGITNTPRDYAWGSIGAIAALLGRTPSGGPEAELWLGAHAGSPSTIVDPSLVGGARTLAEWIAAAPVAALGSAPTDPDVSPRLPFLLKILAANGPLSLQAHPSPEQARAGFELENAAGVPIDAAERSYRDPFHKPELIYALSETFEALCGFRDVASVREIVDELRVLDATTDDPQPAVLDSLEGRLAGAGRRTDAGAGDANAGAAATGRVDGAGGPADADADASILHNVVSWLLRAGSAVRGDILGTARRGSPDGIPAGYAADIPADNAADNPDSDAAGVGALVERVVALAEHAAFLASGGAEVSFATELETVRALATAYPNDPGIVLSLLLNRISLKRGEALYLPAGNIHAYLSGLGVELMAASDNVLRGGLTPKHIDVDALLEVLNFDPLPVPFCAPDASASSPGVTVYRPDVPDFELVHIEADAPAGRGAVAETGRTHGASDETPGGGSGAAETGGGGSGAAETPAGNGAAETGRAHGIAGSAVAPAAGGVAMRQFTLTGPGIAICTAGGFLVAGGASSVALKRGQSVYITPDERTLTFAGAGEVFLATTGA